MKVKLCGGYDGDLGEITASFVVEMPFVPEPGMSISIESCRVSVDYERRLEWHSDDSTLWVDVQQFDDRFFAARDARSFEDLVAWFSSNGWFVAETVIYPTNENNDMKRGE